MIKLSEFTRKEFFNGMDKRSKNNSKKVTGAKYVGIENDYTINMDVPSVTANPPTTYRVKINLSEYDSLSKYKDLTISDKVRLALDGDIKISCTCPAFKYFGYEYIMTELDSKVGSPQTIYPTVKNPNLEGTICKHCYVAARYMGRVWKRIAKDIQTQSFL